MTTAGGRVVQTKPAEPSNEKLRQSSSSTLDTHLYLHTDHIHILLYCAINLIVHNRIQICLPVYPRAMLKLLKFRFALRSFSTDLCGSPALSNAIVELFGSWAINHTLSDCCKIECQGTCVPGGLTKGCCKPWWVVLGWLLHIMRCNRRLNDGNNKQIADTSCSKYTHIWTNCQAIMLHECLVFSLIVWWFWAMNHSVQSKVQFFWYQGPSQPAGGLPQTSPGLLDSSAMDRGASCFPKKTFWVL